MHLLPTRHSASRPDTGRLLRAARKIFLVVAGNAILALGIALFIEPTGIISGGTTGIGLVFQSLFGLPIPVTYGIVNLVCFVLGLVILGWQFAAGTLLSTVLFPFILSAAEQLPPLTDVTGDLFLCAVAAGVLSGAGMGLVIGEGASTGGLDIPPILCNRCFGLPVGSIMLVLNLATLAVQKIVATPKQMIYGILSVIVTSMVLDAVLKSGRQRTQVLIMSQRYEQIQQQLLDHQIGVTMFVSEGGYAQHSGRTVLCAVPSRRLPEVKQIVSQADPTAFVLVSAVSEIIGRGFSMPR